MKVREERSTFVAQAQRLKDSVTRLYPDLPGVPLRAWGPVFRKARKLLGPEGKF